MLASLPNDVPKFDPSCFICVTTGVYALCGWVPPIPVSRPALMPPATMASMPTRPPRSASFLSFP